MHGNWRRLVVFVGLVPLFPFNLLNYALSLTRISFTHYLAATALFMLPGAVAYGYLGYAGREAVTGGDGLIQKILLGLGLIAVVTFLPRLVGRLRLGPTLSIDELRRRMAEDKQLLVLDVRSADDYQGKLGHIKNTRNIALESLPSYLTELADHQEKPVALICTTDRRSKAAAQLLIGAGFADVHVVLGGMTAWNKQAFPVKTYLD